jgi:hypothetical protein
MFPAGLVNKINWMKPSMDDAALSRRYPHRSIRRNSKWKAAPRFSSPEFFWIALSGVAVPRKTEADRASPEPHLDDRAFVVLPDHLHAT